MYAEEFLTRQRHQERLRQAQEGRSAHRVAALRKLEKRQQRAEAELLDVWQRVDRMRSRLGVSG
jgi:hypothetical protein